MGYDIALLVSEVDDEFLCSICTMVLENPMQSPCEHLFCNDCITQWLKVKTSCPVDSYLLALADMKPTPRFFRNLLDKVEVKCNFEPKGCQKIVPLGQQHHHLTKCAFNPNAEVICDKGCNIKITRSEYEAENCFTHLANRQRDEITKLSDELNDVRCEVTRYANDIERQREEITKLTDEGSMQLEEITNLSDKVGQKRDEISKLSDELSDFRCAVRSSANVIERQREQITKLTDVVSRQQDEITKLNDGVGRQREDFTKLTNNGSMQVEEIMNLSDEIDQQRDEIANLIDEFDQQRDEITNVNDEISRVSCEVTSSANVIERLNEEITKLTDEGNAQRKETKKLSDEVRRFTNLIQRQQEEITELKYSDDVGLQRKSNMKVIDEARIFGEATPKWQIFQNIKTSIDQPQVLEQGEDGFSLAQTVCSLGPLSSSFKIKILNAPVFMVIGLTPYAGFYDKSIGYGSVGELCYNGEYVKAIQKYGKNDVIECGITFPDNFENDGKTNVEVYFSLNEQVIVKKVMVMPFDGFFPTVSMWQDLSGPRARVEFLN